MNHIYPMLVPEHRRVDCAARRFGVHFSILVEPAIYAWTAVLAPRYTGGYWDYFCLCNGGFFMAPSRDEPFDVSAPNGFTGTLSSEALGIAACLYTFSHASFEAESAVAGTCADLFHQLRAYAVQRRDAAPILAVID
jgi:hypothetical protein